MSVPESTSRPLHYASPRRRRSYWLPLVLISLIATVYLAGPRLKQVYDHARYRYVLHRAASHELPDRQLVYEEGPYDPALKLPELYSKPVLVPPPAVWIETKRFLPVTQTLPESTLFLHKLRSPNGTERIVHLGRSWQGYPVTPLSFSSTLIDPTAASNVAATIAPKAVLRQGEHGLQPFVVEPAHVKIRFYAGRPDPANPARFVIPFAIDDQLGLIEGELTDWGTLHLVVPKQDAPAYPTSARTN